MADRDDIKVYWSLSPRAVVVEEPATEVIIQDLHDTLKNLEDDPANMIYPEIITTAGGEPLGGGASVGYTSTLQDALVAFGSRTAPLTSGLVTENESEGLRLIASGASFLSDGVYRGCTIMNWTTRGWATLWAINSDTELQTLFLDGGSRNDWQIGDEFTIYPNEQCSIAGGNLTAVDVSGVELPNPVLPTANVNLVRTSSSSATALNTESDAENIAAAVWDRAMDLVAASDSVGEALLEMYRLQGLLLGAPMSVSSSSRTVSGINQTISEVSGVVTVERT